MPADRYAFLLDATPRERIQIAKLGDFSDPRYGDFTISPDEVKAWGQNLAKLPGGRAPIDIDHAADKPGAARDTRAAGWITNVALEDGVPVADVEWTPAGEKAIADKEYLFFSPSYGPWQDEQGNTTPDVLHGGALTNKPFLNMPTVCLARADVFATEATPAPADSRPTMPTISPKILDALGVSEDADEAKLLSAITELKAEPKSLEAQASDAGKVLLDAAEAAKLREDSDKVTTLAAQVSDMAKERADEKFDAAYTAAKRDGKVDAKDETRELHRSIFDLNPELAIKNLAALPKIVNTTAQGSGGHADEPAVTELDGFEVDADKQIQLQRAEAWMSEHESTDLRAALAAVGQEA